MTICYWNVLKFVKIYEPNISESLIDVQMAMFIIWFSHHTRSKEHTLRLVESRVRRRIFGPNEEEVTGSWRKMESDEVND